MRQWRGVHLLGAQLPACSATCWLGSPTPEHTNTHSTQPHSTQHTATQHSAQHAATIIQCFQVGCTCQQAPKLHCMLTDSRITELAPEALSHARCRTLTGHCCPTLSFHPALPIVLSPPGLTAPPLPPTPLPHLLLPPPSPLPLPTCLKASCPVKSSTCPGQSNMK